MLPHSFENYTHLFALAETLSILIADDSTPERLRRLLIKFTRKLKKNLPERALREVSVAEAEAVVKAARYLRLSRSRRAISRASSIKASS